jgi:hypothetical protein
VKKALLITALAASFVAPSVILSAPASAGEQVVAQSAETLDAIQSEMNFLRQQLAQQKAWSGDTDKDYMAAMKMLHTAMMKITSIEMQNGKDAMMMKNATDSMKLEKQLDEYTHEAHG